MKRSILPILCILLTIFSIRAQETQAIITDDNLKDLINEKNAVIAKLYAEGNIDSAATYFADHLIQMPPNSKVIRGKEGYIKKWNEWIAMGKWEFDLEAIEVRRSGPMAVELGRFTLTFHPNENAPMPAFTDKGNYLVLWEKTGGDWKIVWDAPVSELPVGAPE